MERSATLLSRRSFIGASAAALAAAGLGCRLAPTAQAAEPGTTFVYAIAGDPGSIVNPITTSDRFGLMTLQAVYTKLAETESDGSITYLAAESIEEGDDGVTYTVKLREGIVWSDGEPLDADDVVFTYEAKREDPTANGYSNLNFGDQGKVEIAKVDDLTVQFVWPFRFAAAMESFGGEFFIAPEHIYADVADWEDNDVNTNSAYAGPYLLDEYVAGQYVKFVANENYFRREPKVETVVYQVVTNENTGMTAIQAGEVNAWIGTPSQVEQMNIEGNGLQVTPYSEGRVAYFCFNAHNVPDERVRKALFYALDKDTIARAALLDPEYYELAYSFLPPVNAYYNADVVEKYEQDLDKARDLLEEAGVSGLTLRVGYASSDSLQETAAIMMQEMAAAVGITLELQAVDSTALYNAQRDENNEYDLYFGGYIMGVDPSTYSSLFTSDAAWNYIHYNQEDYPQIDELFSAGDTETDEDARRQIYDDLQAALADSGLFYPLYSNMRLLVTTQNVGGFDDARLVPIYTFEDLSGLTVA
jgi:peptide/nickel transport system substrate-binding protein